MHSANFACDSEYSGTVFRYAPDLRNISENSGTAFRYIRLLSRKVAETVE
jgi:hypothetical protein